MDKLMEIKKLYESGILTKEEMETEKAKILRPISSVTSESKKETVASNNKPQPRTSKGTLKQGLFKDTKIWLIAGSVVAVMLIIAIIIQNGRSSSNQTYDNDYAVAAVDSEVVETPDDIVVESKEGISNSESNSDDWTGNFTISGGMYKTCQSMALLSLSPSSETKFTGEIALMLGEEDDMGRFDFFYGELTGTIRGELSENGSMRIYLGNYNIEAGSNGDFISNENIQKGQLLFVLKHSDLGYEVEPVMAMKSFFDGVTDDTRIIKR